MTPADWIETAELVTDRELKEFRQQICIYPHHFHVNAIGSCQRCRAFTPSCSMLICSNCSQELQVCPYDLRLIGIPPDRPEVTGLWLALWMRGFSVERKAAAEALQKSARPEAVRALEELEMKTRERPVSRKSPASAEFLVGFRQNAPLPVSRGSTFLDAKVLSVNEKLNSAVVFTEDAVAFEEKAKADPRVEFIQLNRW